MDSSSSETIPLWIGSRTDFMLIPCNVLQTLHLMILGLALKVSYGSIFIYIFVDRNWDSPSNLKNVW